MRDARDRIDWRAYVRRRLPALDTTPEREVEIVDELALQLESTYEAARDRGFGHQQALQQTAAEITDWPALARHLSSIERPARQRRSSDEAPLHPFSGLAFDLRYAARSLWHARTYSIVATVTLALGLGLGAAAFALLDGVLLRPLPYGAPHQLALLKAWAPSERRETAEITYPDALEIASAGASSFSGVASALPFAGTTTMTDPPSRVEGLEVSTTFLATLGVQPARGRAFVESDGAAGGARVAVVSHAFWQRLGAPADIIGRPLMLNEVARTIVGVLPPEFRFHLLPGAHDVLLPFTADHPLAANRNLRAVRVLMRLAEGIAPAQASAVVDTIGQRLARGYPLTNRDRTFRVSPLQEEVIGAARPQVLLVAGLAALVLLVAAVNFAGLLLARAAGRMRETTVRLALGAGRWRLLREAIVEALLVSAAGAAMGVVLANAALDLVRAASGAALLPRLADVAVDARTLGALSTAAGLIACLAGVTPVLVLRRFSPTSALRAGLETTGRPALRLRSALIVGQTSLAFMLLAAATLLAASLHTLLRQPLGFETDQVVTMRVSVPPVRYDSREATVRFYTELLESLRSHPAVESAGVVSNLPLAGNAGSTLTIQGREDMPLALRPTVGWQWTSPGYFRAMGMPVLQGRDFEPADLTRDRHVTIINDALARQHFADENPIGRHVYFGGFGPDGPPEWHEVIGVVGDVRHRTLEADPDPRAYDLFGQHWGRTVSLAVRSRETAPQIAGIVRALLADRDPQLAVFAVQPMTAIVGAAVSTRRLLLAIVIAFASVGVFVALIGLYGTVAYMVAQRTREMGVRLALGASGRQIRRLVLRRGLQMVAGGIALGVAGGWTLRQTIESQLFGLTAMNVPALGAAALALLAAAATACLVPAIHAMRINPVEALKSE